MPPSQAPSRYRLCFLKDWIRFSWRILFNCEVRCLFSTLTVFLPNTTEKMVTFCKESEKSNNYFFLTEWFIHVLEKKTFTKNIQALLMSLFINAFLSWQKENGPITKVKAPKADLSCVVVFSWPVFCYLKGLFWWIELLFLIFNKVHTMEVTRTDSHFSLPSFLMLFVFFSSNIVLLQLFKDFFKIKFDLEKDKALDFLLP